MRPTQIFLISLLLASQLPGSAWAELNLPKKTIVVHDFSRKRRDLLDTLTVNLPDAKVEIVEFRGAEVVLRVAYYSDKEITGPKLDEAVETLKKHCDGLIRKSYPGMVLAPQSIFAIRPPPGRQLDKKRMARLRQLRRKMPPTRRGLSPEEISRDKERAGIEAELSADPEALYQKLLAKKLAQPKEFTSEAPTQEVATAVESSESPESSEEQPIIIQRLKSSGEISPETMQEVQSFHQRRGLPHSSLNTIRRIYAAIYAERRLEDDEGTALPSPENLPPLRGVASNTLDQELEALFESPRENPGSRLGLSMVSFPAPEPSH